MWLSGGREVRPVTHLTLAQPFCSFFYLLAPAPVLSDPDDAFSSVPYEKGFNFLTYLENLVGGESVMNAYLRAHVERFAHTTVNSSQFKAFFLDYMRTTAKVGEEVLSQIDWDTWYNKPGMPAVENVFDQTLIKAATDLADVLLAGGDAANAVAADATKGWDSAQSVIFLERFIAAQKDLAKDGQAEKRAAFADTLKAVDAKFAFSASQNCELKFRWLTVSREQRRWWETQRSASGAPTATSMRPRSRSSVHLFFLSFVPFLPAVRPSGSDGVVPGRGRLPHLGGTHGP